MLQVHQAGLSLPHMHSRKGSPITNMALIFELFLVDYRVLASVSRYLGRVPVAIRFNYGRVLKACRDR
jgi:hypothetical protein